MKADIILWLVNFYSKYNKWIWFILAFLCVLSLSFIKGCSYGRKTKKCPEITTSIIIKHDTVTRTITDRFPYYVYKIDTVIYDHLIPADVDTTEILRNYFATYKYQRYWTAKDTLEVFLTDYISQNKPIDNVFRYKWLLPQTITNTVVDNSVHYSSYLYIGGSVPINNFKYSSIDLTLALPKWYVGAGYLPGVNAFSLKGGIKLVQFKK